MTQIAWSELNTARFYSTVRNVLRAMFWTASRIINMSTEKINFGTLHTLHKAVDATEYIQFRSTDRSSKMTGRGDTDSRVTAPKIFSTVITTKRMCTLRRYSSFPCADLDPYVLARIYFEELYIKYTTRQDLMFTNKYRLKFHP